MIAVGHYSGHCLGRQYLHAEPLGMGLHLFCKLAAADTLHEPGIVVDALGGPRLATDAVLLDDYNVSTPSRAAYRAVVSPTGPLPTITKS